jgi:Protein of unknown function (DUF1516)
MIHLHITSWVLVLLLFVVALMAGNAKTKKIAHMTARMLYFVVIASGIWTLTSLAKVSGEYFGKAILGIVVIAGIEMVLVRTQKGRPTGMAWAVFIVSLVLTIALGLRLPLGMNFF